MPAELKLKPYQLETGDGQTVISIPACDTGWANIAVHLKGPRQYKRGGRVQHKVSLPEFEVLAEATYGSQLGGTYSMEMPDTIYQAHLEANRPAILALIEQLNTPGYVPASGSGV